MSHQGVVVNEAISCLHFDYSAVSEATGGFNPRFKLGEGGFGPVYKGELLGSTEVAIKVLRRTKPGDKGASDLANEQFEAELQVLSR
jgi:predicted Ser/Thr protein kinase